MNDQRDTTDNGQSANQEKRTGITRRNMLRGLGVMAAATPLGAAAAEGVPVAAPAPGTTDLLDEHFTSASGQHFGSQIIHAGEQKGYQVTPISQDKASPCYQRPGNMKNPTVAALLGKVMAMEGTQKAIGGPCGMGIISQTYLALLKPGDRVVAHRCNYDWVMTFFREYLPTWAFRSILWTSTIPRTSPKHCGPSRQRSFIGNPM